MIVHAVTLQQILKKQYIVTTEVQEISLNHQSFALFLQSTSL